VSDSGNFSSPWIFFFFLSFFYCCGFSANRMVPFASCGVFELAVKSLFVVVLKRQFVGIRKDSCRFL
jgi:hypothetical protein